MFQLLHLLNLSSDLQELNIHVEKVKWNSFVVPFKAFCLFFPAPRDATGWDAHWICELMPPSADCLPQTSPWLQTIKGCDFSPPTSCWANVPPHVPSNDRNIQGAGGYELLTSAPASRCRCWSLQQCRVPPRGIRPLGPTVTGVH